METSQDLECRIRTDAKDAFHDYFGNPLNIVAGLAQLYRETPNENDLANLQASKEEFYRKVDEFLALLESELTPKGKITRENVQGFFEFRESDWTDKKVVKGLLKFYYFLCK